MKMPSEKVVNEIRRIYPEGCRVELVRMDDVQAPPIGTLGTVLGVDDMGSVMVSWDTGSTLSVVYGVDECKKIEVIDDVVYEQILEIRDSGLTNMLDMNTVQRLAYEYDYYELVTFIEEHKSEYIEFILNGKKG